MQELCHPWWGAVNDGWKMYPMQIGLLCKGFFTDVAFVGAFTGMALFMFPPAAVLAKGFQAYAAFVDFFIWCCIRAARRGIICLRMMNHSMSG